jgi:hypothetical protein
MKSCVLIGVKFMGPDSCTTGAQLLHSPNVPWGCAIIVLNSVPPQRVLELY